MISNGFRNIQRAFLSTRASSHSEDSRTFKKKYFLEAT